MAENDTLLAHLAPWVDETLATEALKHILTKSPASKAALDTILRDGGLNVSPINDVTTQANGPGRVRVDMACNSVANSIPPVLVEVKFSASLTPNQPNGYLEWLLKTNEPSVLLFVVPESRIVEIWTELQGQVARKDWELTEVAAERRSMRVNHSNCHLMVISWRTLLDSMALQTKAAGESPEIEADIQQLAGLASRKNQEGLLPPLDYCELDGDLPDRQHHDLRAVIRKVIGLGVRTGWANTEGLRNSRQSSAFPYGHYFKIHEERREFWLGIDDNRWRDSGYPLWLAFQSFNRSLFDRVLHQLPQGSVDGFVPINIRGGADTELVVQDIANQLQDIANTIRIAVDDQLA